MSERSLTGTFYDFPGESSRSAATTGIRQSPDFAPLGGLPATAFAFTVRAWLRSARLSRPTGKPGPDLSRTAAVDDGRGYVAA